MVAMANPRDRQSPDASLRERAVAAYERGDEDAVARLSEALRHQPHDGGLLIAQARARAAIGDPDALGGLEAMLGKAPDWLDGHVALAQLRWEAGRHDSFLAEFEAALKLMPQHAGLWFRYMKAIAESGAPARAADVAHRLRKTGGDNPALRLIEARYAGLAGDLERAGALLDNVPDELPDKLFEDARHRLRLGDAPAAAARLEELRSSGAMHIAAWALMELAWRAAGDPRHQWLIDPLHHVRASDLPLAPDELERIAHLLRGLHRAGGRPLGQSVREGTQTPGNLWRRSEPEIAALRAHLLTAVAAFAASLPALDGDHPLRPCLKRPLDLATGWSIRLGGGGHHVSHIHAHGVLSSACYVAVPQAREQQEGWIELGRPPADIPLPLPPLATLEPRPGRLILFPSYLYHGTRPFAAGERLTVAFDVSPAP